MIIHDHVDHVSYNNANGNTIKIYKGGCSLPVPHSQAACQPSSLAGEGWLFLRQTEISIVPISIMNVCKPSQDFYKSYLTEGGYREKRFVQLGAKEGMSEQRILRSLNDGTVPPANLGLR